MAAVIKHSPREWWQTSCVMLSVGTRPFSVSARCSGDVGMNDSSVHTTLALSWVLIDMSLFQLTRFWSGMRQAEAIRLSARCVSQTLKYHLGGFPFTLWSLLVWRGGGPRQQQTVTDRACQGLFPPALFFKFDNVEMMPCLQRGVGPGRASLVLLMCLYWDATEVEEAQTSK